MKLAEGLDQPLWFYFCPPCPLCSRRKRFLHGNRGVLGEEGATETDEVARCHLTLSPGPSCGAL